MSDIADNLPPISFELSLGNSLRANGLEIDIDLENVSDRLRAIGALRSNSCLKSVLIKQAGSYGTYHPETGELVISIGNEGNIFDDEKNIARVWHHETDHVEYYQTTFEKEGEEGVEQLQISLRRQKTLFLALGGIAFPYTGAAVIDTVGRHSLPDLPNIVSAITITSLISFMYYGFRTAFHKTFTSTTVEKRAYSADAEFAEQYTDSDAVVKFLPHQYHK